jgi:hypothetical protein
MTADAWMLAGLLGMSFGAMAAPAWPGTDREGAASLCGCGLLGVAMAGGLLWLELWATAAP